MDDRKVQKLKLRIKSLTKELNECINELTLIVDGDTPVTGATDRDMGVQDQLSSLLGKKG